MLDNVQQHPREREEAFRIRVPGLSVALALAVALPAAAAAQGGELRFADLGECALESGEVIEECRLEYRTFGALNADRSNAVLFPTWFAGTTEQIAGYVGAEALVDDSDFFVITVGTFANGLSSSPSNSERQSGTSFPRFTFRDMVAAQHRLLTEVLEIERLHGVVGISAGAHQAFEWSVARPDFVGKVVAIAGSPRLPAYDLLLWQAASRILEQCRDAECASPGGLFWLLMDLTLRTPEQVNAQMSREVIGEHVRAREEQYAAAFEVDDALGQLRAELSHDVTVRFGGSLEAAARAVRADLLTVVGTRDHAVTPGVARTFTELVGGRLLELDSPCGHLVFVCEAERIGAAVREFLAPEIADATARTSG